MTTKTRFDQNTVVVMDNSPADQAKLGSELGKRGFVHFAAESVAAAELAARDGADKFVIDIEMTDTPGDASGLPAIDTIRKIRPAASIVVFSAFAKPHSEAAHRLGADDVVVKKHNFDVLVLTLEICVLRRQVLDNGGIMKRRRKRALRQLLLTSVAPPLAVGAIASAVIWRTGLQVPALSRPSASAALALAILCAALLLDHRASAHPVLQAWPPFRKVRKFLRWLNAAIVGGIVYDVLKILFALS